MEYSLKGFLVLLIVSFFFSQVIAEEYRRCYSTGFCQRNINPEPRNESYIVVNDSVVIENNTVKMSLKSYDYSKDIFSAEIKIYKYGIFRLLIDENYEMKNESIEEIIPKKMKKRFRLNKQDEIFNVINLSMKKDFTIVKNDSSIKITSSYHLKNIPEFLDFNEKRRVNYEIFVEFSPFKITYSIDDSIVFIMNNNNYMNYETLDEINEFQREPFTSVRMDFFYPENQKFFGLLERAGDSELRDTDSDYYRMYNIDLFEYPKDQYYGLYGTWPFIMGHKGRILSGLLWNNPSETYVRVHSKIVSQPLENENDTKKDIITGRESMFLSESGIIDIAFFSDFDIKNFYYKYHKLIGKPALPPVFSLGYHQSRWNYEDLNDLTQVDEKFDEYDIPYDTIWLDIEHTNGKRYMTWDSKFWGINNYLSDLERKGRNLVVIIDPHIKNDEGYQIFAKAKEKNYFVRTSDMSNIFIGKCWCEDAAYLDYFNLEVREYWKNEIIHSPFFFDNKNIHIWNDMNEPSVFNQVDMTIPKDIKINYFNETYDFRDVHNMYGYFMHKSSFEALKKRLVNKRPFILTRSFYIGSHRYAAVWTGDNIATYHDLQLSIQMLINSALCGFSFIGADVGGFSKNTDHILMRRWFQFGIFYPFFRGHSHNKTYRKEPYIFDSQTMNIIRSSIILRYKLLPYIYTSFYQYYKVGTPVIRPSWFNNLNQEYLYNANNQMFFGESILVRPVLSLSEHEKQEITVIFPENYRWYSLYTYNEIKNISNPMRIRITDNEIGAFIIGGSIIPLRNRVRRSSKLNKEEPYALVVALSKDQRASGNIYIDDEETYNFEKGKYCSKRFVFQENELSIINVHDNYQFNNEIERIVITGLQTVPKQIILVKHKKKAFKRLEFEYNASDHILVIHRFRINLDNEIWKIKLIIE